MRRLFNVHALAIIGVAFGVPLPVIRQSHMFRRGTVSLLKKFNLDTMDINLWVGWAPGSTMIATYYRPVVPTQPDFDFFYDIIPK